MLKADDSEQACIPAELQLADFCQLRQAEIGHKQPFVTSSARPGVRDRRFLQI